MNDFEFRLNEAQKLQTFSGKTKYLAHYIIVEFCWFFFLKFFFLFISVCEMRMVEYGKVYEFVKRKMQRKRIKYELRK